VGIRRFFRRRYAIPAEHGAWVLFASPLLIGFAAGREWNVASNYLLVAAIAGFMIRQPFITIARAHTDRQKQRDLPAARFWILVYGTIAALHVTGLVIRGFGYLLWLTLPGMPVALWHLYLISRRAERRQILVEILGTGALCLAATAGMWVGLGRPDPLGWVIWALTWGQSGAAVLYAYLRLGQRMHAPMTGIAERLRLGKWALGLAWLNLVAVITLSFSGVVSRWLFIPFAIQAAESLYGTLRPAIGLRPRAIGMRQLFVSVLFTIGFILTW